MQVHLIRRLKLAIRRYRTALREGFLLPVSYTHLDVYKRQALERAIGRDRRVGEAHALRRRACLFL